MVATDRVMPVALPVALKGGPPSAPWKDLIEQARQEAARQEVAAITEWERDNKQKAQLEPPAQRRPIVMEQMYAHTQGRARTLYYEAHRNYKKSISGAVDEDPAVLVASGWIHARDGARPAILDARAAITSPDFTNSLTITPLAILTLDGGSFWLLQEHGYESEALTIVQISEGRVLRIYDKFIGGC
jgi:hypothetical protein